MSNPRHAVGNCDLRQLAATRECHPPNTRKLAVFVKGGTRQLATTTERRISDARYAVGNGDLCQLTAARERTLANARHTVGNGDAHQPATTTERRTPDARHAAWNGDARQPATIIKCAIEDIPASDHHFL